MSKLITVQEAVKKIKDGHTVAVEGFVGALTPEDILYELEQHFIKHNSPQNLTMLASTGQGDLRGRGLDHFAHEGLLKKIISAYYNVNPRLQKMVLENKVEGYMLPLGVIAQLYRETAAGRPGLLTHTGLGTFVDPRLEGGRMNEISHEEMVNLLEIDGREWLLYKPIPMDIALVRGTTADERGNITLEKEVAFLQGPSLAMAAKNCGGTVIAQVERIARAGTLHPKAVKIPGIFVDYLVVARKENHMQTFNMDYNPAWSGEIRGSLQETTRPVPFDYKKVIGRRAVLELEVGAIVNLGVGLPEYVASISGEEGISNRFTLTVESGPIGGIPAYGINFGAATNPEAIMDMPYQFDFYDGGGIDITFVGLAQVDAKGNVNVSKLNERIPGVGGFLNVTQGAKKVVFCGSFTAKGCQYEIGGGRLEILKEGKINKFIQRVQQITFSGSVAINKGQVVKFVTERAVFQLTKEGLILKEIAPGVKLREDILDQMEFEPIIDKNVKTMPQAIFEDRPLHLSKDQQFQG